MKLGLREAESELEEEVVGVGETLGLRDPDAEEVSVIVLERDLDRVKTPLGRGVMKSEAVCVLVQLSVTSAEQDRDADELEDKDGAGEHDGEGEGDALPESDGDPEGVPDLDDDGLRVPECVNFNENERLFELLRLKLNVKLAVSSCVNEAERVGVADAEGIQDLEGVSEGLAERVPEELHVFAGLLVRDLVPVGE
eukprot:RCo001542